MRLRVKFSKQGVMKFIGHLDTMRYFQKAIRRAGIDITYSSGFSPHQIMSFASPLGVGYYSSGEYMDIEVNSHQGREKMLADLNAVMVEGIQVLNVCALPAETKNAMASVTAASYTAQWKAGYTVPDDLQQKAKEFICQETIPVVKHTKKNSLSLDLKPGIFQIQGDEDKLCFLVDAGSSNNISPTLLLETFCRFCEKEFDPLSVQITREETYTTIIENGEKKLIPLDAVGEDF